MSGWSSCSLCLPSPGGHLLLKAGNELGLPNKHNLQSIHYPLREVTIYKRMRVCEHLPIGVSLASSELCR